MYRVYDKPLGQFGNAPVAGDDRLLIATTDLRTALRAAKRHAKIAPWFTVKMGHRNSMKPTAWMIKNSLTGSLMLTWSFRRKLVIIYTKE